VKEGMEWNPQVYRKEEGQREDGREQCEKKYWLLGRHGEKLNNSV
jgi:hypothetical protein